MCEATFSARDLGLKAMRVEDVKPNLVLDC